MRNKHSNPLLNFIFIYIEDIVVILMKGFVGCLVIGLLLELLGYDLLAGKSSYTHGLEIFGTLFFVGIILHNYIWK
ncbi:MAG: hypothetical protein H8E55_28535 [Pelagibacterales bacterium]|nr:hypothetical protein [Pelagibacterales bacterium]